ncbi:MAG: hypothetical protein U5Q16_04790 [Gammaproteobacteria bacterium]|nr:hypothetical protein [Gammaproteobacteria bacterium]
MSNADPKNLERLIEFTRAHENEDPAALLLKGTPEGIDSRAAAEQIRSRQKARSKLPHWYAAQDIVFPPPLSMEQASSQVAAAYKVRLLEADPPADHEVLVDLTGGAGVDALAFSQAFPRVIYVERDAGLCRVFAHNASRLTARPPEVVNDDAAAYLRGFRGQATFYLDPDRRDPARRRVFRFEDSSPDVVALLPLLRQRAQRVLVKASPMIDLSEAVRLLGDVREIHVVSISGDCREVLFLLDIAKPTQPTIRCVELDEAGTVYAFDFDPQAERTAQCTMGALERYLYDPGPAIRKAGAFRTVAERFGLNKLAPNTHLYTADRLVQNFPGRVFDVDPQTGKALRRAMGGSAANVMVRNHPLSAEELKHRYRLRDGGERWLIGFRDAAGRAKVVAAHRVA